MAKQDAIDTLTIKISYDDLVAYTNQVYTDIADPAINGINTHAALTNVHGLPAIVADINAEFQDVWDALDTKVGVADLNLSGKADKVGDTFTGTIVVNTVNDHLVLRSAAGVRRAVYSKTNGNKRWEVAIATNESETGGNKGSNFAIARYADNGQFLDYPFSINRETGVVSVNEIVVGSGGIQGGGGGFDIRVQTDEPTANLAVGTVWLRPV